MTLCEIDLLTSVAFSESAKRFLFVRRLSHSFEKVKLDLVFCTGQIFIL